MISVGKSFCNQASDRNHPLLSGAGSLRKAVWTLLFLATAGGWSNLPAQTVCDDGSASRAATRHSCATLEQLQSLLDYVKKPGEDEDAVRDLLIVAAQVADCLKDEKKLPPTYGHQQDYLCLQQKMLAFYARVGDGLVPSRASSSFYLAWGEPPGPRPPQSHKNRCFKRNLRGPL